MKRSMIDLAIDLGPNLVDYLKKRDSELTARAAIEADRDVDIAKIENFAKTMLAAIEGTTATREQVIAATSEALRDAIAQGNTEAVGHLARVLAGYGNITSAISEGYTSITGRQGISQS